MTTSGPPSSAAELDNFAKAATETAGNLAVLLGVVSARPVPFSHEDELGAAGRVIDALARLRGFCEKLEEAVARLLTGPGGEVH